MLIVGLQLKFAPAHETEVICFAEKRVSHARRGERREYRLLGLHAIVRNGHWFHLHVSAVVCRIFRGYRRRHCGSGLRYGRLRRCRRCCRRRRWDRRRRVARSQRCLHSRIVRAQEHFYLTVWRPHVYLELKRSRWPMNTGLYNNNEVMKASARSNLCTPACLKGNKNLSISGVITTGWIFLNEFSIAEPMHWSIKYLQ